MILWFVFAKLVLSVLYILLYILDNIAESIVCTGQYVIHSCSI